MWTCKVCAHTIEDSEEFCYHCGSPQTLEAADAARLREKWVAQHIKCLRCRSAMKYAGLKKFPGGTRNWKFWLGDLGAQLAHRDTYDLYVCPNCGRIEMFADGLGEDLRLDDER